MLNECRALVIRDKNMPTMEELEEKRRRKREDRQRAKDRAWEMWWARMTVALFIAVCVFTVVVSCDISQDRASEAAKSAPEPADLSSSPILEKPQDERSFDFDDPSPITEKMALLHLIRYGGHATILVTDARELSNRFTKEQVLSLGQLRRYEVMLDLHDQRIDGSMPDKLPRDVVAAVMHDLRE